MNITLKQPAALHERGTREVNEDYIYPNLGKATIDQRLFIVCDGMGGHDKGDIASKIVADQVSNYLNSLPEGQEPESEDLKSALKVAESELSRYMKLHSSSVGMGSTLSLVYFGEQNILFAWVGNSPIFYYHKKQETLLAAQNISPTAKPGEKSDTPDDIPPIIYGEEHPAILNIRKMPLDSVHADDYIFVASDGILEQVGDRTLSMLFKEGQSPEFLIKEIANLSRGSTQDDFSCYMLQIEQVTAATTDSNDTSDLTSTEKQKNTGTDINSDNTPAIPWKEFLTPRNMYIASGVLVGIIALTFLGIWWFSNNQKQEQFDNLYSEGQALLESQNYEAAADTLRKALELAPDETNKTRVRSMFDQANDRALDNTRSMSQLKSLGDNAFKTDQWGQAVYYYEKAKEAAIRDTLVVPEVLNENLIIAYVKLGDFYYDGEDSDLVKSLTNYQNALQIEATDEIKGESDYLRASVRVKQLTNRLENNDATVAENATDAQEDVPKTSPRPSLPSNPNKSNVNIPVVDKNNARITRSQSSAQEAKNLNDGKTVFARATSNNSAYEYKASANYLLKASNALDGEGAYMLAIMYHEGRGVSTNKNKALQYAKISAQKGWPSGHYLYAHLLLLRQFPKDTATALSSLRVAAAENHPQAITRLNELQIY